MSKIVLYLFLLSVNIFASAMDDHIAIIIGSKKIADEHLKEQKRKKKELIAQAESEIEYGFCGLLAGCLWLSKMYCLKPVMQPMLITESDCYILGCSAATCCMCCIHGCYSCCCKSKR